MYTGIYRKKRNGNMKYICPEHDKCDCENINSNICGHCMPHDKGIGCIGSKCGIMHKKIDCVEHKINFIKKFHTSKIKIFII